MPKQIRNQLTGLPQSNPQQGIRQVRQQVAAQGADTVPNYIPQVKDPALEGLVSGLSQLQPTLQRYMEQKQAQNAEQATTDSLGGLPPQKDEPSYTQAYFHAKGVADGQQDASLLLQKYNTEFDKDKGNLDAWLPEQSQTRLKGIQDEDYLSGYRKSITPAFEVIRKQNLDYHRKAVETQVESSAMQMLSGGVRAYLTTGPEALPDGYITSVRDYMGKHLGVSSQRFDELLFDVVRTEGDNGYIDAYEVLKRDHPDGTPGLYNDPAWRQKIDQAAVHSWTVSQQRAQHDRDERQNKALFVPFEMLYDGKTKEARAAFDELRNSGLFSRAEDLIKWEREFSRVQNSEARSDQQEKELTMQAGIYQGKVGIRDVIGADLTAPQKRSLLSEVRRVQLENQQAAERAGKAEDAVYRTADFRTGEEFIKTMLKPRPKDPSDIFGNGTEFDRAQLAQAVLEFTRGARGKSPQELRESAEEISTRYVKRRTGYDEQQQKDVGEARMPFRNLQEVRDAATKGLISTAEFRSYIDYFRGQMTKQGGQ